MSIEQRVFCARHHWSFSVTAEGIVYKCRAGECRKIYTIPWGEIDEKRLQVTVKQVAENFAVPARVAGEIVER